MINVFLLSCKIPEDSFENPLDLEANAEKGIFPPALVFSPDSVSINSGESVSIDLYALAVDSLAGAQIEIDYFNSSLSLESVEKGNFFSYRRSCKLKQKDYGRCISTICMPKLN